MKRIGWIGIFVASMSTLMAATSAWAVDIRNEPQAAAAPTQPVVAKPLEAPAFESDTRNISAIVNRDDDGAIKPPSDNKDPKTLVKKHPTPQMAVDLAETPPVKMMAVMIPPIQMDSGDAKVVKSEVPPDNTGVIDTIIKDIRVFAIRWQEVLDILFLAIITLFTGLLCRAWKHQNILLAHSVRAAEDAAHAAQKSLQMTEKLFTKLEKSDESQISFEL